MTEKKKYTLLGADGKPYLSGEKGTLGGNSRYKIYGRLDCPSVLSTIRRFPGSYEKHRVFFKDEETAIAAGYRPCGTCMREKYKLWKAAQGKITGRVYVARRLPARAMEALGKICEYDVNPEDRQATREELLNGMKNYSAIISMLNDTIDSELISQAGPSLKLIANYGVGFNNIDVKAANDRGIYVSNTPGVLTDATADLAWALLFSAARRVVEGDNIVRTSSFSWAPEYMLGYDITGRTLGIIGAGRIGSNFGRKAALGFNMNVIYYARHNSQALDEIGAKLVSLDELLEQSDYVSLHVPLTPETRHLIGAKELSRMKRTAIIINTARGPVIDEKALAQALKDKVIAAAGLDVYEREPEVEEALKSLSNVVLMPHVGSATFDTRTNMGFIVARNVEAVLAGSEPPDMVRI